MKKAKILLALIVVLTMMFTVAYADDSTVLFGDETGTPITSMAIDGNEGDVITFTYVSDIDTTVNKACSFQSELDKDVWEIDNANSTVNETLTEGGVSKTGGGAKVSFKLSKTEPAPITKGMVMATIKLKLKKNLTTTADFESAKITLLNGKTFKHNVDGVATSLPTSGTLSFTKKTASKTEPSITAGAGEKGATITVPSALYGSTTYKNVYTNSYTVTPGDYKVTGVHVDYHPTDITASDKKTLSKTGLNIEGEGTYTFKIAIVGVGADTEIVTGARCDKVDKD